MMVKLEKVTANIVERLVERDCTVYPNYHQRGTRIEIKNGIAEIIKNGKKVYTAKSPLQSWWKLLRMHKQLKGAQVLKR